MESTGYEGQVLAALSKSWSNVVISPLSLVCDGEEMGVSDELATIEAAFLGI